MMRIFFFISCTFLVLISPLHPIQFQSFSHDKQAMAPADIACLLSPEEKVLWAGNSSTSPLIFKLATLAIITVLVGLVSYKLLSDSMPRIKWWMAKIFILYFPIGWGMSSLFTLVNALNADYVITKNGLFLKLGLLRSDTKIIKWSNIENIELRRGFLENLFFNNIGSIYIDTKTMGEYDIISIPHYTEVYRLLKQTMKEASK